MGRRKERKEIHIVRKRERESENRIQMIERPRRGETARVVSARSSEGWESRANEA